MNITDFPSDFPKGVNIGQLGGYDLVIKEPVREEGRCETCHHLLSTHIFNVGVQMHHLCKGCFEKMLRTFADKSGFMLLVKPEAEKSIERHFKFTEETENQNGKV